MKNSLDWDRIGSGIFLSFIMILFIIMFVYGHYNNSKPLGDEDYNELTESEPENIISTVMTDRDDIVIQETIEDEITLEDNIPKIIMDCGFTYVESFTTETDVYYTVSVNNSCNSIDIKNHTMSLYLKLRNEYISLDDNVKINLMIVYDNKPQTVMYMFNGSVITDNF